MNETVFIKELVARLKEPFPPEVVQWKPGAVSEDGTVALGLAYVDSRVYMDRLDEAAPGWTDDYEVIHLPPDRVVVLCRLTVAGVTRCGDGEAQLDDPNAVTSASAQAFKRACTAFGLGRYLYAIPRVWAEYDPKKRYFTRDGLAVLRSLLTEGTVPPDTDDTGIHGTQPTSGNGNGKSSNGGKDARQVQVKFGKYNGQTLGEIAKVDPDYLEWLAENWRWETGRKAAAAILAHIRKE